MVADKAPSLTDAYPADALRIPAHEGENFMHVLARIHAFMRPRTYLEIGTQTGEPLSLATCSSIAIDPGFRLSSNVFASKPSCLLFQCSGDAFFAEHDPKDLLGGSIEFAFLDGMHWFEWLLRDFINVERHARPNSIIAIHDCIPTDIHHARRDVHDMTNQAISDQPGWWTGDVWKVIHLLRRARPDLQIHAYDAAPTGLVLITRLDPANRMLEERYFDLIEEMRGLDLAEFGVANYVASLGMQRTDSIATHSQLSELFWL